MKMHDATSGWRYLISHLPTPEAAGSNCQPSIPTWAATSPDTGNMQDFNWLLRGPSGPRPPVVSRGLSADQISSLCERLLLMAMQEGIWNGFCRN